MRTHGSKLHSKTSLQNHQKLENLLGNIKIFPAQNPIFLARNPIFLNGFPTFVNGFLLSSMAFQFSSTAFHFPRNLRKSIYDSKYPKDHYLSFVFPATCSPSFVIPATKSTSPPTASPKFIIESLSKFEKFLPKFTTLFKNNKLLIPTLH